MSLSQGKRGDTLLSILRGLRGNARACVFTEPLWGIPAYLYMPFASLYMSTLGLSDASIGLVGTIFLLSSMVFSLLSGVLTDKLGRRFCTFWFDLIAWSVPTLLWALAKGPAWFMAAAFFNGSMRITSNSWNLLLIEDEEESGLVKLYTLVNMAANISAVAILLSYPLVHHFGLVNTVRGMYSFAVLSMTAKFVILYVMSHETRIGKARMEETRHRTIVSLLGENAAILGRMLRTPKVMLTIGVLACFMGSKSLTDTFFPLLVTGRTGLPGETFALFSAVKCSVMVLGALWIAPKVSSDRFKHPLLLCLGLQVLAKLLLICMPQGALWLVWLATVIEAVSLSLLNPLTDTLQMVCMDVQERARVLAVFYAIVLSLTAPLSYIGGLLSDVDRVLPFVLTIALCIGASVCGMGLWRQNQRQDGDRNAPIRRSASAGGESSL